MSSSHKSTRDEPVLIGVHRSLPLSVPQQITAPTRVRQALHLERKEKLSNFEISPCSKKATGFWLSLDLFETTETHNLKYELEQPPKYI